MGLEEPEMALPHWVQEDPCENLYGDVIYLTFSEALLLWVSCPQNST